MSSVGSSTAFSRSIDLDVVDSKIFEVFGVGVGFEVVNESQDHFY